MDVTIGSDVGLGGGGAPGSALRPLEIAVAVLLGLALAPALLELSRAWSSRPEYAHGYLIPLVSLWALLRERRRFARLPVATSGWGLALLAASLGLYAFATAAGVAELAGLGLVGAIAGAVLWLRGPAWLRALTFPIAFLLFLVPVPESWLAPVVVELRLFVTKAATGLLHAIGVPVAREGNVLLLPGGGELFVADACSGVTSLVTLTPLAVMLAWFTEQRLARRIVLVLAVVPIALGGNLLRVVATVLAARRFGVEAATEGSAHESLGLLAYVLGCLALLGVGAAMRRLWPAR